MSTTKYDTRECLIAETDSNGDCTDRLFDARDRMTHEAAPLGKTTVITYDGRDQWRTETRSNAGGSGAQVRERRYDDDGRLVAEIDATGVTRTLAYDDGTNVIQRSDGRGHLTRYRYDARNNLVEEKGPEAGQLITYGYDANNNRTHEHWPNGRELVHTYDAENRRLTTTDNLGLVEARTYWPDGLPKTLTDADGRTTHQFHDSLHRMTREELPGDMSRVRHFTHTIHGEVKTQTDPRGHTTTFDYDALGRITRTTHPLVDGVAAEATTQYDAAGNVRFQTNARQQTTEYRYNALNQRTDQIDPIDCADDEAANAPTAPKANRSDTAMVPTNADASRQADTARGLIASFVGTAKRLVIAIAAATAPIATSAQHASTPPPSSSSTAATKAITAACTQSWTYDTENNVLTHTDRRGITTTHRYDQENRLLQQDRAGLTLQTLVRDAQGNVRTQTDALQRVTTFTYDKANRKTDEDRSGIAAEAWTYTPLGDIATHTDADDRTTAYTYTPRRFLESESLAGETTRYTHDGTDGGEVPRLRLQIPGHPKPDTPAACRRERRQAERGTHLVRV